MFKGQDRKGPEKKTLPTVPLANLVEAQKRLDEALKALVGFPFLDEVRDISLYERAAKTGIALGENDLPRGSNQIEKVLKMGLKRATQLGKSFEYPAPGTWVCRAHLSRIDDSLQPYAVKFPRGYFESKYPWPMEIVLHGRSDGLTEAMFLEQHEPGKPTAEKNVLVEVFGRGNNAYRWAGETDVLEVLDEMIRREGRKIDTKRIVLRGFSMGGAGTWHIGLHYADRFCVIQPGAGFTKTIGYAKTLPKELPAWQLETLHRYDAVDAAPNVAMVPVVAYSGGDDPQKEAAINIERALAVLGMPKGRMKHIIAPGLGHKMPPEWKTRVDQEITPFIQKGIENNPKELEWIVNDLRHGRCHWIEVTGLKATGQPGRVVARKNPNEILIETHGITHLDVTRHAGDASRLIIDGTTLEFSQVGVNHWVLNGKHWEADPQPLKVRKRPGLQGPIDDAFMDGFIVTIGTGKPWSEAGQKRAVEEMERFRNEWNRYMRGDFPFVPEDQVTEAMEAGKHLVVFGDPGSSRILARITTKLPYKWEKDSLLWKGKSIKDDTYLPFSIQPNPEAPWNYLVINSGHTFHEEHFKGTNALLFSQHGDHGLYHVPTGKVFHAGHFDQNWKFPAESPK